MFELVILDDRFGSLLGWHESWWAFLVMRSSTSAGCSERVFGGGAAFYLCPDVIEDLGFSFVVHACGLGENQT